MVQLQESERIGEGRLSVVYKLSDGKMLKVFKCEGIADYEFRQTMAIWQAGVSRQRPYEKTDVEGKEAIVYDYLEGTTLMDVIAANRAHVLRYIRMMAGCHAAILKGVSDGLPNQKDGLAHAIGHAPHLEENMRQKLMSALPAMPGGNNVLHGDLHPMNIIISGDELSAIDWMTGSRGDPAADIARTYFIMRYSTMKNDRNALETLQRSMLHGVLGNAYLRQVCRKSGVRREAVLRWLPFIAAGRLTEQRPDTEVKSIMRLVKKYCL